MPNFKLIIAYDGAGFVGWQRQASGTSIQGLLEDALATLDKQPVAVTGAGRTDAGVHALGQVASCSLQRDLDAATLVRALNAVLPDTVRVLQATAAPAEFHARFDARAKTYCYRIWNAEVLSPFERAHVWHISASALDVDRMAAAAALLEGRHDFAAFQGTGSETRTTERVVLSSRIGSPEGLRYRYPDSRCLDPLLSRAASASAEATADRRGFVHLRAMRDAETPTKLQERSRGGGGEARREPLIVYEIRGEGFLRHMVRNIVGTLVEIGRGRRPAESMRQVLASRDRAQAGRTAPAGGLFLVRVDYDAQL